MSAFKSWLRAAIRTPLEGLYERRLAARVHHLPTPRHVGVILDGNRRWAALQGGPTSRGHRVGAGRISNFLEWCDEQGVEVVTLWLLSTENLQRSDSELIPLLGIIERTAEDLAADGRWQVRMVGALDSLPAKTAEVLVKAEQSTQKVDGMTVNMAVGYGGRREVVDAIKSLLVESENQGKSLSDVASELNAELIGQYLYTKGQPDPDLVIRTSGEQRLSGFLLWQSAHSEYWFCEAYWPDFRRIDFLRALRDFGVRKRRFGN
jgi:short-chain Z-isoprenyl diphosphate synthase